MACAGPALGIALAAAFIGAVWAEGTIAGEQAARLGAAGLTPAQRAVTITWQGAATPAVDRQARAALGGLGLGPVTTATLLSPVRLQRARRATGGDRAARAVDGRRRRRSPARAAPRPAPFSWTGPAIQPGETLGAPGVRLPVTGTATLRSAAPLGFVPGQSPGPPVVLGSDPAGLERLPGLSSFYRTESWLALLPGDRGALLAAAGACARRLQRDQATLLSEGSGFSMAAPFGGAGRGGRRRRAAPRGGCCSWPAEASPRWPCS